MDREAWLASEHLQLIPQGRPMRDSPLDDLLAAQGVSRRIRTYVMYIAAVGPMLEGSALVTTLPTAAAKQVVRDRELLVVPHPLMPPRLALRMTWHRIYQLDKAHRWLRELISECMADFVAAS